VHNKIDVQPRHHPYTRFSCFSHIFTRFQTAIIDIPVSASYFACFNHFSLNNNDAELAARVQVRKHGVSLHTMTEDGTKANDTFLTIVQTAKKLDVSRMSIFTIGSASVFACLRLRN
jgi:hypothetical protein